MTRLTGSIASKAVADSAVAWDQSRREAKRLRGERASMRCEHESQAEYNEHGSLTAEAEQACWRKSWQDSLGRDRTVPVGDWCEPCRQRQAIHEAYTKAVHRRQALMRWLQRRALAAWESAQSVAAIDLQVTDTGKPTTRVKALSSSSVLPGDPERHGAR